MILQRRSLLGGLAAGAAASAVGRARAAAATPQKGGTLNISAFSDVTSFDPATGRSGDDHIVLYTIYDTLIDYDFDTLRAVRTWRPPGASRIRRRWCCNCAKAFSSKTARPSTAQL